MAKSIKSMTKAELVAVVIEQGARLDKAKFYYRQQRDKINELVAVNESVIKLLRKKPVIKTRKK
jgi:hypothetical protein